MTLAIILFAVTYVLMISFGKYRPYIALASGALFILTGMLPANQIIGALDFNVLLMLAGTMGTVDLFIRSKMPNRLSDKLVQMLPSVKALIIVLALFAGLVLAEACHTERRNFEYKYTEMIKKVLEEQSNA